MLSIGYFYYMLSNLKRMLRKSYYEYLQERQVVHSLNSYDIARLASNDSSLCIRCEGWIDGCISLFERASIGVLLQYHRPGIVLEVGTYRGTTTRLLLDNTDKESHIYSIDLPPGSSAETINFTDSRLIKHREVGSDYREHEAADRVTQILGDTFEPNTWKSVPTEIDFAFIDASHSYEAVENDTAWVRERLAENGLILWHDYHIGFSRERGVGRYLREEMRRRDDIFVIEGTSLGVQFPLKELNAREDFIRSCYMAGDYTQRKPKGVFPWLIKEKV